MLHHSEFKSVTVKTLKGDGIQSSAATDSTKARTKHLQFPFTCSRPGFHSVSGKIFPYLNNIA